MVHDHLSSEIPAELAAVAVMSPATFSLFKQSIGLTCINMYQCRVEAANFVATRQRELTQLQRPIALALLIRVILTNTLRDW